MLLKFMNERDSFTAWFAIISGVTFTMNRFHMFINISGTKFLITKFTLFSLGFGAKVPFNMVFQVLHFVHSSVADGTFEPSHLIVYEGVFPVSVDPQTGFLAHGALAGDRVALAVGLRDAELRVHVAHVVGHELGDA